MKEETTTVNLSGTIIITRDNHQDKTLESRYLLQAQRPRASTEHHSSSSSFSLHFTHTEKHVEEMENESSPQFVYIK